MNTYLITGASGYIGAMLTERLIALNQKVTVIVRNPEKLSNCIKKSVDILQADLTNQESVQRITGHYDNIIHCAAATQSAFMMSNPVEVANSIVNGTQNILELATRCRVHSMVYLSSMEVYGKVNCPDGKRVTEKEIGKLDITNIRSCYPMAKRMAEHFCHLYHKEYGVPVKTARLAQTFGRGVPPEDNRVFAQFARAVNENKDIILHTKGNSVGNYCDIDDVMDAVLFLLEKGQASEVYNVVNEKNTMTIHEMATLVAEKIAGGKIRVTYDIPNNNRYGYAVETGLRLSGAKLKTLGWEARISLDEMYHKMVMKTISGKA